MASGKLLVTFPVADYVNSAVFSPNGSRVVTTSLDKTVKLWDAVTSKLLAIFDHGDVVNSTVFSPDGTQLLTASQDHTAKLWDAISGKLLATFDHDAGVTSATFSPDGTRVVTASWDSTARLWDAISGKLLATFIHQEAVPSATFSPDGTRLVTASWDGTAKLWDAASGESLAAFTHDGGISSASFSPDGTRVVTASWDKTAKLWDAASGKLLATMVHDDGVASVAFSPDGTQVLTASWDHTAQLWGFGNSIAIASMVTNLSIEPRSEAAERLLSQIGQLAMIASRFEITDDGEWIQIPEATEEALTKQLLGSALHEGPFSTFIGWLLGPGQQRSIFPGIRGNGADWIHNAILAGQTLVQTPIQEGNGVPAADALFEKDSFLHNYAVIQEANDAIPGDALLEIDLAHFEKNEIRANFLRNYAVQRLPNDLSICVRAGELLLQEKSPSLAASAAEKALAIDARSQAALHLRARCLLELASAKMSMTPVMAPTPVPSAETIIIPMQASANEQFAKTDVYRALSEVDNKEYRVAISDCTGAIRLKPDYAEAYFTRGVAYSWLRQYGKGASDFSEAIRLKPDFAEAYGARGGTCYRLKQYNEAISDFSQAIRLKPDLASAYEGRAYSYEALGNTAKAAQDTEKARELRK